NHVNCASFAGADWAVVGMRSQNLFLMDTASGKKLCVFNHGHLGGVTALAVSKDGKYLLSASADLTVRVWSLAAAKEAVEEAAAKGATDLPGVRPLLSLFTAGSDWIAWTPEGYYAASPDGDRYVGWLIGHGNDKFATFYPAEQFR